MGPKLNSQDLCLFVPCFPAFSYLLISLGQWGLIVLLIKSGLNLGQRGVIPYSQHRFQIFKKLGLKFYYLFL